MKQAKGKQRKDVFSYQNNQKQHTQSKAKGKHLYVSKDQYRAPANAKEEARPSKKKTKKKFISWYLFMLSLYIHIV